MRPVAIGRKNYLFLGSDHGGNAAAVLYSVMASAKANQVEPFVYVRDLLVQLSGTFPARGRGATSRRLADGAPRSSSVLVEVAGLPGATKSKTADLTAMRDFELRDEFSGLAARRFVAYHDLRRRVLQIEPFPADFRIVAMNGSKGENRVSLTQAGIGTVTLLRRFCDGRPSLAGPHARSYPDPVCH